jgi:hypothetical protein
MPTRVECDLYHAIDVDFSFQIVEQPFKAQRVPIVERDRFPGVVRRPDEPAAPNLHQQPSLLPGTETVHSEQKLIVPHITDSP